MPRRRSAARVSQPGWQRCPAGLAQVAGAAGDDAFGRVYLVTRRASLVLVHTLGGEFLPIWGSDTFTRPHGITVLPDGPVLCVDDGGCSRTRPAS